MSFPFLLQLKNGGCGEFTSVSFDRVLGAVLYLSEKKGQLCLIKRVDFQKIISTTVRHCAWRHVAALTFCLQLPWQLTYVTKHVLPLSFALHTWPKQMWHAPHWHHIQTLMSVKWTKIQTLLILCIFTARNTEVGGNFQMTRSNGNPVGIKH